MNPKANGHDPRLVAKVSTIVTEALLEALPETIRARVEAAMTAMAEQVERITHAHIELRAECETLKRELAESKSQLVAVAERAMTDVATGELVNTVAGELVTSGTSTLREELAACRLELSSIIGQQVQALTEECAAVRRGLADSQDQLKAASERTEQFVTASTGPLHAELATARGELSKLAEQQAQALSGFTSELERAFKVRDEQMLERDKQITEHIGAELAKLPSQRDLAVCRGDIADLSDRLSNALPLFTQQVERCLADMTLHEQSIQTLIVAEIAKIPPPKDGTDGRDGADGQAGAPGPMGPQGPAGESAVFTKPLPYTLGKNYERGAIVMHRGGEWLAEVATDQEPGAPMSGWALIHDGVEPLAGRLDEDGFLVMRLRCASGREYDIPLGYRPWQYAGIYDTTRKYWPNDLVSDDGGIWLALGQSTGRDPGTPNTGHVWRLIQKRPKDGRDGKPGRDGFNGAKGEKGDRGHDGASVVSMELSAGGMLESVLSDGRTPKTQLPVIRRGKP